MSDQNWDFKTKARPVTTPTPPPPAVLLRDAPEDRERLADALRNWRGVFVDPDDPDAWYADSADAIIAALRGGA